MCPISSTLREPICWGRGGVISEDKACPLSGSRATSTTASTRRRLSTTSFLHSTTYSIGNWLWAKDGTPLNECGPQLNQEQAWVEEILDKGDVAALVAQPESPQLFVRTHVEKKTCKAFHNNIAALKSIAEEHAKSTDEFMAACRSFPCHVKACIAAKGRVFQKRYSLYENAQILLKFVCKNDFSFSLQTLMKFE